MIRQIFVGNQREFDSVLSVKFDHFLDPMPDKTLIIYGPFRTNFDLLGLYKEYGVDTSTFEVIPELEITKGFKEIYSVNELRIKSDPKYSNAASMMIAKMVALDWINDSEMMHQDGDAFPLAPYKYFGDNGKSNVYTTFVKSMTWDMTVKLTGKDTPYDFTPEIYALRLEDWNFFKSEIERINGMHYIDAYIDYCLNNKTEAIETPLGGWAFNDFDVWTSVLYHSDRINCIQELPTNFYELDKTYNCKESNLGHLQYWIKSRDDLDKMLERIVL